MSIRVHASRNVACLALFLALVGTAVVATTTAAAAELLKLNHFGTGAVAAYNTCTPQPNGDELCEDFVVYFAREGFTRDDETPSTAGAALEHFVAFIHPDGTATEVVAEYGSTKDVSGSYDVSRLTFARMNGARLHLNDIDPLTGALTPNGRTATLGPFVWTAASSVYVFGNDGPFGFGFPRHFVDRCVTEIENAHERFTTALVTGTINGVSVDAFGPSYLPWPGTGPADARGAIFNNRFTVLLASHAPGC